jgi:hypothetical protein
MKDQLVYAKTQRGTVEVTNRAGGLTLAARRVLIMIDGKRTVAELAPLLRPGEVDGVIANLEAQGYVQRVGGTEGVAPAAPVGVALDPITGEATEERTMVTLDEAKRRAVRALIDRLGPDAETMSIRIEQSKSVDELRERLREAERLVAALLGEAAVEGYQRALRQK